MGKVEVVMVGIAPMLMNRISEATLLSVRDKTAKKAMNKVVLAPREEANGKVHTTEDGKPIIPANVMMANLISAGKFIMLDKKRQLSTATSSLLPSFLTILEPFAYIKTKDQKSTAKWEVDMQAGKNPNGGELVCIVRPRFDDWSIKFTFELDLDTLPETTYRQLFDYAGVRCGLGDFRPSKKGIYGKYVVQSWKMIKE